MEPKAEPKAEVGDEGAAPRDTVVTFTSQHLSYMEGEVAAFTPEEAQALIDSGAVVAGDASTSAPVNVDVPHVQQAGDVLTCTMGNWIGSPTAYAYAWQGDGGAIGTDANTYTVTPGDAGTTVTCIVTATNANGATAAPPSNGVVVAGTRSEPEHETRRRR
jgi:hypothetical protein